MKPIRILDITIGFTYKENLNSPVLVKQSFTMYSSQGNKIQTSPCRTIYPLIDIQFLASLISDFMECEVCGKRAEMKARIEGTVVSVCKKCSNFGEPIYEARHVELPSRPKYKQPEETFFVTNFSAIIKNKREELPLSREQLADRIKEKVSVIERIEKGMRPEKNVAEKLERILNVKILSSIQAEKSIAKSKNSEPLTLGDVVEIRRKKK